MPQLPKIYLSKKLSLKLLCPLLHVLQVHRVFVTGVAGTEGTIQRGDYVLSINGSSLEGTTHGEALSCLHQARLKTQALVVTRRSKDWEAHLSPRRHLSSHPGHTCPKDNALDTTGGRQRLTTKIYNNKSHKQS